MKGTLHEFIEGQTYSGMPRGVKLNLALDEPEQVAHHLTSNTASEHATQPMENHWDQVPTKNPIDLKG